MKKTLRIILPILLAIAIVVCAAWYLMVYDRAFTRDMLLAFARQSESGGNHTIAAWFYKQAYSQSANNDEVAIELAEQYKEIGNFTKAEYTLSNAISDGGGVDLYIALSKTYVEQDKILDAVNMLNNITNPEIKQQLDSLRPQEPKISPEPGFYNQYISVTLACDSGTIYVSTTDQYPSLQRDAYKDAITLKDGENTLYCVAVAENGLVSPLKIYGYTVGGVVEKMVFSDSAVEAEVRNLLNVPESKELYTNDLWTIKAFTMPSGATSYADLKHMVFLESLTIDNGNASEIYHISSLANLTQLVLTNTNLAQDDLKIVGALPVLKSLTIQGCRLTGIAPLVNSQGLIYLDLSNNTIRDISALQGMSGLQELYLGSNAVVDLSAISSCTALTKLDVSSNALTSLAPINQLTGLAWLNAAANQISDLGDMSKLSSLSTLTLNNNKLTDVSGLALCTAITELNLSTNEITDISALSGLSDMLYLDFSFNQVTAIPSFPKNCALAVINGNNNNISSLKPLSGLKHLNNVHMDYNTEITSVDSLVDCPLLIEVNIYETKVNDVSKLTGQSVIVNYKPV